MRPSVVPCVMLPSTWAPTRCAHQRGTAAAAAPIGTGLDLGRPALVHVRLVQRRPRQSRTNVTRSVTRYAVIFPPSTSTFCSATHAPLMFRRDSPLFSIPTRTASSKLVGETAVSSMTFATDIAYLLLVSSCSESGPYRWADMFLRDAQAPEPGRSPHHD